MQTQLDRFRGYVTKFPQQFWLLMGASLVDMMGGWMLFPFFSLYFTEKFGIGMTQVGFIFAIFSVGGLVGNALGGALTDRFGRKIMVLVGLVFSASSSIAMAFITDFNIMYPVAAVVGLFGSMGEPAQRAMVADLLPEEDHADGFAVHRMLLNVAAATGPIIGGVIALRTGYYALFLIDAATSIATGFIITLFLRETKPATPEGAEEESVAQTFAGYGIIFRDAVFITFVAMSTLLTFVYMQINSTMSVYLRDSHGVTPERWGYLLSMNAVIVVTTQLWVTGKTRKYPPMLVLALGALFYAVGFGMFGFVSVYGLFIVGMLIITVGEMIVIPTGQAVITAIAPADMRGRYIAVGGLQWGLASMLAPLLAGIVMDKSDPVYVWYIAGILGILATVGFVTLNGQAQARAAQQADQPAEAAA